MTPHDLPDVPMSSGDDSEWIKGLVAKALLLAADEEALQALEPVPAVPPSVQWSQSSTLDTAGVAAAREAEERAAAAVRPQEAAMEPHERVDSEALADPPQDVDPTVRTNSEAVLSPHGRDRLVADQHDDVGPFDQGHDDWEPSPVTNGSRETNPMLDTDAAMVEADATTEGFRSSDIRTVLEWLAVIVSALVVALLIKALVLQAFWIPSESMETTVNKGDRILVNKVSYRLHDVRRGDLVVFEKLEGTPGNTKDLIKRAIALPGETIEIRSDGRIWIWGAGETPDDAKLLQEPYLDPQNAVLNAPSASDPLTSDVWDEQCTNQPRTPGRCTLDAVSYFMMGDNRQRSSDSRFFGPVPEENIVGRAFLRIWPLGDVGTL